MFTGVFRQQTWGSEISAKISLVSWRDETCETLESMDLISIPRGAHLCRRWGLSSHWWLLKDLENLPKVLPKDFQNLPKVLTEDLKYFPILLQNNLENHPKVLQHFEELPRVLPKGLEKLPTVLPDRLENLPKNYQKICRTFLKY